MIANGRIDTNTVCCLWRAGHAVTAGPCSACVAAGDVWITNTDTPYRLRPRRPTAQGTVVRGQKVFVSPPPLNRAARRKAAALARRKK